MNIFNISLEIYFKFCERLNKLNHNHFHLKV